MLHQLKGNLLVLGGLAGKLDLQIGIDRCGCGYRFRYSGAHHNHRKFCATCHLQHVEIAVAVPRIKRLHWYRDQKIALSFAANTLASRGMTNAIGLMQRVRDMIRESGFFKNPLAIRDGQPAKDQKQKNRRNLPLHKSWLKLNRYGQNGGPIGRRRHPGDRPMRLGYPMNLFSIAELIVSHYAQNRGQDHPRTVNPGEGLV